MLEGKLDVSAMPRPEFFDGVENTSALTQFARSTAAYVLGFQRTFGVKFYAISPQNELNFETFYNSCTYPQSEQYIAALVALRKEFDKYPELRTIKLIGPEDLLGGDAYGLWEYGKQPQAVDPTIHKNLKYLTEIAKNQEAMDAMDFFCIHGYSADGVTTAGGNPQLWNWWAKGWGASPAEGLPNNVLGFTQYGKKCWMTESSGEAYEWLSPSNGFPKDGAYSIALKIYQALVAGKQSAYIYWQMSDGRASSSEALTDSTQQATSPKFVAMKHFSKFIRPGAQRMDVEITDAPNVLCVAYQDTKTDIRTAVLINTAATESVLDFYAYEAIIPEASVNTTYYTSSPTSLWQQKSSDFIISNLKLPPYSVVTVVAQRPTSVLNKPLTSPLDVNVTITAQQEHVLIRCDELISSVRVYDIMGKLWYSVPVSSGTTTVIVPTAQLASGLLTIEVETDRKQKVVRQFGLTR